MLKAKANWQHTCIAGGLFFCDTIKDRYIYRSMQRSNFDKDVTQSCTFYFYNDKALDFLDLFHGHPI